MSGTEHIGAAVTLHVCKREVLGTSLDWDIEYPDCGFSLYSSVPPGNCRDGIYNEEDYFYDKPYRLIPTILSWVQLLWNKLQKKERGSVGVWGVKL
jgi:hypothetical protein